MRNAILFVWMWFLLSCKFRNIVSCKSGSWQRRQWQPYSWHKTHFPLCHHLRFVTIFNLLFLTNHNLPSGTEESRPQGLTRKVPKPWYWPAHLRKWNCAPFHQSFTNSFGQADGGGPFGQPDRRFPALFTVLFVKLVICWDLLWRLLSCKAVFTATAKCRSVACVLHGDIKSSCQSSLPQYNSLFTNFRFPMFCNRFWKPWYWQSRLRKV